MRTLYLDTHLYDIDVILFEDNKIVKEGHVVGKKQNSSFLMPTIKEVLDNETFDEILIVNGPGSFTGVRLGVTVAKTLAYTLEKPIKVVSYFDLMNFSSDAGHHIFGIDDGNGYFIGEYNDHKLVSDYSYIGFNELEEYKKDKNVETDVTIDYKKVLESVKNIEPTVCHAVKPIYVKLIGVENDTKNK